MECSTLSGFLACICILFPFPGFLLAKSCQSFTILCFVESFKQISRDRIETQLQQQSLNIGDLYFAVETRYGSIVFSAWLIKNKWPQSPYYFNFVAPLMEKN